MDAAYSIKDLGLKIKEKAQAKGLALAEETIETLAVAAYEATKEWAKESADLSTNKVDDFIAPYYDKLDVYVVPQIEKLDLNKDGK